MPALVGYNSVAASVFFYVEASVFLMWKPVFFLCGKGLLTSWPHIERHFCLGGGEEVLVASTLLPCRLPSLLHTPMYNKHLDTRGNNITHHIAQRHWIHSFGWVAELGTRKTPHHHIPLRG